MLQLLGNGNGAHHEVGLGDKEIEAPRGACHAPFSLFRMLAAAAIAQCRGPEGAGDSSRGRQFCGSSSWRPSERHRRCFAIQERQLH